MFSFILIRHIDTYDILDIVFGCPHVGVVVTFIVIQFSFRELDGVGTYFIQEASVVTDHDQGVAIGL